jgi:hypothetical protein
MAQDTDSALRRVLGALHMSPTGNHLLIGQFVLPYAVNEADPRPSTNEPDGLTLLWLRDGSDLMLSVFSRTLNAWQTVVLQWPVTVMETRTDDPIDPVPGRFWLRTDLP